MPATTAPSWRRYWTFAAALPALLALLAGGVLPATAQQTRTNKPILAPPPSQWDRQMLAGRPLLSQTVSDLSAITSGIAFGMGPGEVNTHMPAPAKGVSWTALPQATEFPDDVRYFWARLEDASTLQAGASACTGDESYIVFLFRPRGLFRISYRLMPSAGCPQPADAAAEIFGRFVAITTDIALSVHYRAGPMQVVDITDAAAGYLLTTRWQPRAE